MKATLRSLVVVEGRTATDEQRWGELIAAATELGDADAVILDGPADPSIVSALSKRGVRCAHVPDATAMEHVATHGADGCTDLIAALFETHPGYDAVLLPSTYRGRELAAKISVRLRAAIVTDVARLDIDDAGRVVATKEVFAFTWTVDAVVERGLAILTMRAGAAREAGASANLVQTALKTLSIASRAGAPRVRVLRQEKAAVADRPAVAQARTIVAGGRGTGGNFRLIEQLADAVGGAVGASRVAVDAGWVPHAAQIGQTGSVVAPDLYVAVGISGAIQHRAGMSASRSVAVINRDPGAPLFELADLGIVGDLFVVLPETIRLLLDDSDERLSTEATRAR